MDNSRFFAKLEHVPDSDPDPIVEGYTGGKTSHPGEITPVEYKAMREDPDKKFRDPRERARATVLKLMRKSGVDTSDRERVESFCMDPRIAGMKFGELNLSELKSLAAKLRAIERGGGLRERGGGTGHIPEGYSGFHAWPGQGTAKLKRFLSRTGIPGGSGK